MSAKQLGVTVVMTIATMVSVASLAAAQGASKLPEKAASAFRSAFPGVTMKRVERETEGGEDVFHVQFKDAQGKRDCEITPDGKILEVSSSLKKGGLPSPVLAAVENVAPGSSVEEAERAEVFADIMNGTIVELPRHELRYELRIERGESNAEIEIDEAGHVIVAPDWKRDDEATQDGEQDTILDWWRSAATRLEMETRPV